MTDPKTSLQKIFDADRALLRAEADLLSGGRGGVKRALTEAVDEAKSLRASDPAESEMRLRRLADLCAQVGDGRRADRDPGRR